MFSPTSSAACPNIQKSGARERFSHYFVGIVLVQDQAKSQVLFPEPWIEGGGGDCFSLGVSAGLSLCVAVAAALGNWNLETGI